MSEPDPFAAYPPALRASTARPRVLYRLRPGWFAVHGRHEPLPGWHVVLVLDDPPILVCRGDLRRLPEPPRDSIVTPVYALAPRGGPAVPTGLVLVRFHAGVEAADRADAIAREGFAIQDVLPHAPCAAWVAAATGGIAAALRGIEALEALPDVENVEPQMVRRRAPRLGTGGTDD